MNTLALLGGVGAALAAVVFVAWRRIVALLERVRGEALATGREQGAIEERARVKTQMVRIRDERRRHETQVRDLDVQLENEKTQVDLRLRRALTSPPSTPAAAEAEARAELEAARAALGADEDTLETKP